MLILVMQYAGLAILSLSMTINQTRCWQQLNNSHAKRTVIICRLISRFFACLLLAQTLRFWHNQFSLDIALSLWLSSIGCLALMITIMLSYQTNIVKVSTLLALIYCLTCAYLFIFRYEYFIFIFSRS